MKPTPEQIESFTRRALVNLPENYTDRKSDLLVLATILPKHSRSQRVAGRMLVALLASDDAQREFCFGSDLSSDGHNGGGK